MRSSQWPQTLSSFAKDTNYSAVVFMRDESKPLQSARQFITFIFPVFPGKYHLNVNVTENWFGGKALTRLSLSK